MRNFDFSILNAITDNLRNRYDDGFPVLKALIQNADDAGARRLWFGWHPGFDADAVDPPLLTGPALWFLNDGTIKPGDLEGLCAFGINSKAADAATIGKFGLGMKSLFHLCEAFFFVAWDGQAQRHECLSPWNPTIHPDWEQETDRDWAALAAVVQTHIGVVGPDDRAHWFLLWLPLRQARHLDRRGARTGAIIERFPGDKPLDELRFLVEPDLPLHPAEVLLLLQRMARINGPAKRTARRCSPFSIGRPRPV